MDKLIELSDALDILDQFEDAVENGEHFYEQARKMMCELPSSPDLISKRLAIDALAKYLGRHQSAVSWKTWLPTAKIILDVDYVPEDTQYD